MDRIHNFRDLGGHRTADGRQVKRGLLYRSASLADASDADLRALSALGIRTVCDLRTVQERADDPDRLPDGISSLHLPIKVKSHNESGLLLQLAGWLFGGARRFKAGDGLSGFYREYVTDFRPIFSQVIRLAAERDNLPLLIHCTAGKDRTGFACALLQLLLGVPREAVMREYLLSNEHLGEFRAEQLRRFRFLRLIGLSQERIMPFLEVRQEYLEAALEQIARDWGDVENYAREGLGLSVEDRLKLSTLLLE
jgi:protein-tyrosine phosphatase